MAAVLSLPFKFTRAGQAATVEQGSDNYYKQQLATLIMTYSGERFVYDTLGMPDMAFQGFPLSTLANQTKTYLPAITDLNVSKFYQNDTTQSVTITFSTEEPE